MGRLLDKVLDLTGKKLRAGSELERLRTARGVGKSAEWRRIAALPRRPSDPSLVPDLTPVWRVEDHGCPGCPLCVAEGGARLRPAQSWALAEAEAAGGLFAPMGVGHGKELTSLLLPDAVGAKRAVLLTKPRLRAQLLEVDAPRYGRHFRLPMDRITVVAYSELSSAGRVGVLDRLAPDVVVANEAHALRGRDSMRTRQFLGYMRDNPSTRFYCLSGTLMTRSLRDFSHLIELALRHNSPVPRAWRELEDWARALDSDQDRGDAPPMLPGAVLGLCGADEEERRMAELTEPERVAVYFAQPGGRDAARAVARRVFCTRLTETAGVTATGNAEDCQASLVIRARVPEIPELVAEALGRLRRLWKVGDEELRDAKDVARYARQMACGFYYRWVWPGGEPDLEWLAARAAWHLDVRELIKRPPRGVTILSPLMARNAVERGDAESPALATWKLVEGRYRPSVPVEPVWLSDFLVEDALSWGEEECGPDSPGIIWYEHDAVGAAFRARGVPTYGPGEDGDRISGSTEPLVAASILAHGDGKNLQHFCRALVTCPPANGTTWQQVLGREHRPGQRADEVRVDVHAHERALRSAIAQALRDARCVRDSMDEQPKLLRATRVGIDDLDEVLEAPP